MNDLDLDFKKIIEVAEDVIIVTKADMIDPPGPEIVFVNKAFTRLTGYTPEEAIGKTPRMLQSVGSDPDPRRRIREALLAERPHREVIKNYSKYGREYWLDISILPLRDEAGVVTHFVGIERDVTEQKNLELRLERLSRTDSLTGLLNHRAFYELLDKELSRTVRPPRFSILMLDIDHFKQVNDNWGHLAGDELLLELGIAIKSVLRPQDYAARLGGDEFCVLLPGTPMPEALLVAERLRELATRIRLIFSGQQVSFSVSIGVTESTASDLRAAAILKRGDKALYAAKAGGRNLVSA